MKTAIYARQSVEKNNSLSILGQIEACRRFIDSGEKYHVYKDEGYSGKNTKRPALEEMIHDIRNGIISKVIIYRFDRISRSLIDFIRIQELFDTHNITLISCSEQFDTSTEMGRMMLKILIMFAEMERNAIVARISDNYAVRAEKMLYLGGKAPFGYEIVKSENLKYFVEKTSESDIIRQIFNLYINDDSSCEKIANQLNISGKLTKNGCLWHGSAILKILKNPFYTMIGKNVENYFRDNFDELKISENKYYGYIRVKNIIYTSLHKGIIPPEIWLKTQKIVEKRAVSKNSGSGKNSFLQGKMICVNCGKSIYVKTNGRSSRYFECQGRRLKICNGIADLNVSDVENACFSTILNQIRIINADDESDIFRTKEIYEKIRQIDNEILYYRKASKSDFLCCMELDELIEKRKRYLEMGKCRKAYNKVEICGKLEKMWKSILVSDKKKVVDIFVEKIYLQDGKTTFFMK